ncbi:MAG: C-terminal helicase domain-containing protein, partial [Kangiella sp.]|nr:C-terminal helicase domain-containing protein [Kangiella sp.]
MEDILADKSIERVLVFTRTKRSADRVAKFLGQSGIDAEAIHGNKAQNARQRALKNFRSGRIRALVATDIAARGIDVDGVTHVINFELPDDPESYVHRIGRTARAGAEGIAITLCDMEQRSILRDIEKIIRQSVPVIDDHPYHSQEIADASGKSKKKTPQRNRRPAASRRRGQQSRRPVKQAA